MRKIATTFAILGLVLGVIAGCATSSNGTVTLTSQAVQSVQAACGIDAGIRPAVNALLAELPPSPVSKQAVPFIQGFRAVVDPICANPSAPLVTITAADLTSVMTQAAQIIANVQAEKNGQPLPYPLVSYALPTAVQAAAPTSSAPSTTTTKTTSG